MVQIVTIIAMTIATTGLESCDGWLAVLCLGVAVGAHPQDNMSKAFEADRQILFLGEFVRRVDMNQVLLSD